MTTTASGDNAMGQFIDRTGCRFGLLTVLGRGPNQGKRTVWICQCDCGNRREVRSCSLTSGNTRSCGCLSAAVAGRLNTIHGMCKRYPAEHRAWMLIKQRTLNPNNPNYPRYGGAGISICEQWASSFTAFFEHIGPRPSADHSVDRIDNSKGYFPGNVRWATAAEQVQNSRTAKLTPDTVRAIRAAAAAGVPTKALAEKYRIRDYSVRNVVKGYTWGNLK